ncbi:hypothetical protein [Leucobacter sp. USHLN153]|uniref:hypothetical protein n=1 Tax=Leucobacter sp. USHLN153 TaxID=3081268 RepID=UPI003016B5CC
MWKILGILLGIWLVLSIIGFVVKALLWLGIVAAILFCATLLFGLLFQRTPKA